MVTERDWGRIMQLPDRAAIDACNKKSVTRAPYLVAWYDVSASRRFTAISVDIRAEYLPVGTYCSPMNFTLDYSALKDRHVSYSEGDIMGYAGLQKLWDGSTKSILSFWDLDCTDAQGKRTTIRAERLEPKQDNNESFGGEGTGAHCLVEYPWRTDRWYRMLLQCGTSEATGNTTIEQWICDLDSGEWTFLCKYDLGVPNVAFCGSIAAFLECFEESAAGEVRSMEIRNLRILDEESASWLNLESAQLLQNYDFPGSYAYGADRHCVYFITSGVPGLAEKPEQYYSVKVSNPESGQPF